MTIVTRKSFIETQGEARLRVSDLSRAERLKGVDVARADLDKDGVVSGAAEAGALWDSLFQKDRVETTVTQRPLPFLPEKTGPSPEANRLAAVESFRRSADLRDRVAASGDWFATQGVVGAGPARGEPLDTTNARPVIFLDAAQKAEACRKAGVDPSTIEHAFANLSHGGAFYVALVPKGSVEALSMLEESFPAPVPAAHTMLRFSLASDKPAILVPQGDDPAAGTLALRDLVFSTEALGQPGWQYDLLAGQLGHFGLVGRMESLEDRYRHVEHYTPRHPVAVHHLQVSPAEAAAVLKEALDTSARTGLSAAYSTLGRSCSTEAFQVLDRALAHRIPSHLALAPWLTGGQLPPLSENYLAMRGLRALDAPQVELHDEMTRAPRFVTPRP